MSCRATVNTSFKLALVNNTIQFISKFSLSGQSKHLNLAEYVNLVGLGKEALQNLQFETFPSPIMQYHLQSFFDQCEAGIPGYFAPDPHRATRAQRKKDDKDRRELATEEPVVRMATILQLGKDLQLQVLEQYNSYFWKGGPNALYAKREEDVPLIKNAAALIHFIAGSSVECRGDTSHLWS